MASSLMAICLLHGLDDRQALQSVGDQGQRYSLAVIRGSKKLRIDISVELLALLHQYSEF
jgi:hypothetical protein